MNKLFYTDELIEKLDQRYGNPLAKDCELIQEAIEHLRELTKQLDEIAEKIMTFENQDRFDNGYGMN